MNPGIIQIYIPDECEQIALCGGSVVTAMRQEVLPVELCESLERGIWTTCAEILPAVEKSVQVRIAVYD